jgi:Fe2+ or Zn2+ uptake regulation protein
MFCRHKFKTKENLLYCEKCGKTIKVQCSHKWAEKERYYTITHYTNAKYQYKILLQECKKCGELKKVNLNEK